MTPFWIKSSFWVKFLFSFHFNALYGQLLLYNYNGFHLLDFMHWSRSYVNWKYFACCSSHGNFLRDPHIPNTHHNIHAVISFMIRRSTCLLTCSRIVILSLFRCFYLLVCTEYFNNPISLLLFSTFPFFSSLIIANELLSILLHHYLFQSERFFKVTRFPSICLLFYSIILPHCVCLCSVFKFLFWFLCIRIFLFMIFIHFPRLQSLWWLLILPRKTLQRIEIYFPISYFTTRTKAK